jgi:hypothetical protein
LADVLEIDVCVCVCVCVCLELSLVTALRAQTPKRIRGGWSHSDTSEPVYGNGAQYMVTGQSGFWTNDLLITGPRAYQLL